MSSSSLSPGRSKEKDMRRLENKVAIVTGGGRGLGKIFCLAMADEGAKIVSVDILEKDSSQTSQEIKKRGGSAISLKVDVTSEKETDGMAEETLKAFGRIDILVNNAALYFGIGRRPFDEISSEEWDKLMAVNLKGPFLCSKAVFPQMKTQKMGKIINLSSETAFTGSKGFIHYVTSKGGIISFTRVLAAELGPHGICVNSIAPGFTDTEASRTVTDDITKYNVSSTPLGRLQQPQDLIGAILFLASDESDFVTGQTLVVDGGRYMH
jgi:NAD(P)-dependent dehydrogenase (short-subunit alcohol dehydrogenase family)